MKFAPISTYDVAAWQAWLEDEAARGNFLDAPGILTTFTKGEPKAVRYRMEPISRKNEKQPDAERREVYRELGWEYVDSSGAFHFWRCDDPDAPELDTDPQVQGAAYDRLCRQLKIVNWVCAVILVAPILLGMYWSWSVDGYTLRLPTSWTPLWEVLISGVTIVLVSIQTIYWDLSLRRFVRTLKEGIPVPHRRPYRVSRGLCAVTLVVYLVFVGSRFMVLFKPDNHPFEPVSTFEEPVPYVELPGMGEVIAVRWQNWQTPRQWWLIQENERDRAESRYYEFYTQRAAEKLAHEIVEYDELMPLEGTTLDGAWWRPDGSHGYQLLVVWEETRVMDVAYCGPGDLTEHLALYEELLQVE